MVFAHILFLFTLLFTRSCSAVMVLWPALHRLFGIVIVIWMQQPTISLGMQLQAHSCKDVRKYHLVSVPICIVQCQVVSFLTLNLDMLVASRDDTSLLRMMCTACIAEILVLSPVTARSTWNVCSLKRLDSSWHPAIAQCCMSNSTQYRQFTQAKCSQTQCT